MMRRAKQTTVSRVGRQHTRQTGRACLRCDSVMAAAAALRAAAAAVAVHEPGTRPRAVGCVQSASLGLRTGCLLRRPSPLSSPPFSTLTRMLTDAPGSFSGATLRARRSASKGQRAREGTRHETQDQDTRPKHREHNA
jgi:hypothetical protein